MGISSTGLLFFVWFFIFSVDESRLTWGVLSCLPIVAGYFIYRLAILKVFDERQY
ncbi:hypothetical protein [Mangrovibacter yixingensis]|uniref:hypothetical protein n=1 Tax=Mangrovibacter yixingensis TaxID=1529639 RepID=UPI001CFC0881|nr:hypothetical protein [Mangrovibacter yixingensis]